MGKLLTTMMLCAASMVGAAVIGSQGFRPDPLPQEEDASLYGECNGIDYEHARLDCLELKDRPPSRQ